MTSLYKFAAASLLFSLQFAGLPQAHAAGPVVVTDHGCRALTTAPKATAP